MGHRQAHHGVRLRRRAGTAVGTALLALSLLAVTDQAVYADPSDDQAAQAQQNVNDQQQRVTQLEVELAQNQATVDAAMNEAQTATENYNEAQDNLDAANAAKADADAKAASADASYQSSRSNLVALALEAYRSGGTGMSTMEAFLTPGGIDDVIARTNLIDSMGQRANTILQEVDATKLLADLAKSDAAKAATAAQTAADSLKATAKEAQAKSDAAVATQADIQQKQDAAIAELAQLRQTSADIEQARLAQQQQEQQAREDAAADPLTPPAPTPPTPPAPRPPAPTPQPDPKPDPTPQPDPAPPAPAPDPSPGRSTAAQGQAAVNWARQQLGKPYQWGGTGPNAFDCSGLTSQAWKNGGGIAIPRSSRDQYRSATKISYSEMRPGDLIFWGSNPNSAGSITHVAIYAGNGMQIDAPNPSVRIREIPVRWSGTMPYAGRI